ncbi:hypothetical protein BHM03_00062101 [Ensete ventricosum]|nr:hypothetical protein BHM03_00062101 [Ensete ventricosum]
MTSSPPPLEMIVPFMELAWWVCSAFKYAEQAFAGPGPCALGRPLHNFFGTERSWSFYSGCCGLFVGVADLTCARSAVRHLVSFVHPVDRLRRFGHVSGLAVRRCDDLPARSAFALSGDEDARSSNGTASIFYSNVRGRPAQPIVDKDEAEEEGYVSLEPSITTRQLFPLALEIATM